MGTKILVVDDETGICDLLKIYFEKEGYEVKTAGDGVEGINYFKMYEPDLVLLDIMLPKKDGWQVCREIREVSSKPIIMLTAKGEVFDKVLGLELGADDFMVKPVDDVEMILRIRALLRRARISEEQKITVGSTTLIYDSFSLIQNGTEVQMPKKEFQILFKLLSFPNKTFTRANLMEEFWDMDSESEARTVDVHINRLRDRFRGNADFEIQTVRGLGYKAVLRA